MYRLTQNIEVEVDSEAAGKLVAQVLMQDFDSLSRDIVGHQYRLTTLTSAEVQDLADNIEMRDAMKTLLRYYLKHEDYVDFMELQRVYGNVE